MKRRTALRYLGALAGASVVPAVPTLSSLLAGCRTLADPLADNPRVAQGLTNIVVLCMENRSYDHFFGARTLLEGRGGDGLVAGMANSDLSGRRIEIYAADKPCVTDPPHGWDAGREQWNGGKNDGFVTAYQHESGARVGPEVMGYKTRLDLPISYALADAGTICDRWFSSLLGPTWPNRCYLHAGQSGGLKENKLPTGGLAFPAIYHRLIDAKVPWAYYYSNVPFLALWADLGNRPEIRRLENDFYIDAEAGQLPPVVFLDPAFNSNDDHPPLPTIYGQQLVASIYNALARSPQWPNTLFVVTYDEHGGFYDHVPPPMAPDDRTADGFGQLGFRVPTLIAGPYAKIGHVSSVVHDHSSVLAHIEKMFNLKPLTARDAAANTLDDAIDQERLKSRTPAPPITLPPMTFDEAAIRAACAPITKLP